MDIYTKNKVHEICESVKDDYLLSAIEENQGISEVGVLRMKKFLKESVSRIEKMLVEEGYLDYGKAIIEESFKASVNDIKNKAGQAINAAAPYAKAAAPYAKGAGLVGAGAAAGGAAGLAYGLNAGAKNSELINNAEKRLRGDYDQFGKAITNTKDNVVSDVHKVVNDATAPVLPTTPATQPVSVFNEPKGPDSILGYVKQQHANDGVDYNKVIGKTMDNYEGKDYLNNNALNQFNPDNTALGKQIAQSNYEHPISNAAHYVGQDVSQGVHQAGHAFSNAIDTLGDVAHKIM